MEKLTIRLNSFFFSYQSLITFHLSNWLFRQIGRNLNDTRKDSFEDEFISLLSRNKPGINIVYNVAKNFSKQFALALITLLRKLGGGTIKL